MDEVADALDVDHRPIRPGFIEPPAQLRNHVLFLPIR
jgi:hypothetical protein